MTSPLLRAAIGTVRLWTYVYTWRMTPILRDTRRAEIESDLWEIQHDESDSDAQIAAHILARLVAGLIDDVRWRAEQLSFRDRCIQSTFAIAIVALLVAGVVIVRTARPGDPPAAPKAPSLVDKRARLPPPPPPPRR